MLKRLVGNWIGSRSRRADELQRGASHRFIVATFYTEGPPRASGDDLVAGEQYFRETVEDHADRYLSFNPGILRGMDPAFAPCLADYSAWLEQHADRAQLGRYNPVWARMGFQMWKPFLIRHILTSAEVSAGD